MAKPVSQSTLPRPITIPDVMTIKSLADVRKLLKHIPKEKRELSTWQHVQIAVALKIVFQPDGVPYHLS
jgi:hypothetical protein